MRKYLVIFIVFIISIVFLSFTSTCLAQEKDIELLRRAAQTELAGEEIAEDKPEETIFKSGGLGLQALNPEISVTGDFLTTFQNGEESEENHHEEHGTGNCDFNFRGLGLHFESYLDPYSRFKAAVHAAPPPHGIEIEEGYFMRYGVLGGMTLTIGKFRQQFGVVNRWHKHGLDQVDFPLALRKIFGEHGLNQTGISLDWTMPQLGKSSQELTLQFTNGENSRMFEGNEKNVPSILAHYKNYLDLSKSTYFELGLTYLIGWNDKWEVLEGTTPVHNHSTKPTSVIGLDLTLLWEPTDRMRYRNMVWRSELYCVNKKILAPDGTGKGRLNPWGAYTYIEQKVSRTLIIGIRGDYYQPDTKSYAEVNGLSLSPLAVTNKNAYLWQVGPYITWHQSPFVRFRLEYNHQDGKHMGTSQDIVILQCIFAAGPHKHERY